MTRIPHADSDAIAALSQHLESLSGHFPELPNSMKTMAWRPEMVPPMVALWNVIMHSGTVPRALKWMVGHIASRAHGCQYCSAHTAKGASIDGIADAKVEALWTFEQSDLFTAGEKAALRVALGAAQVPNATTDEDFAELRQHYTPPEIVEIISVVSIYGFFNRWNDTFATTLESAPLDFAQSRLGEQGWHVGKHVDQA